MEIAAFLAVAAGLASGSAALAESVTCPKSSNARPLERVEIFDGKPSELASLVPDEDIGDGRTTPMWRFVAGGQRRIWVVCTYGASTGTVAVELPATTRQCAVQYRKKKPVAVDCK